MFFLVSYFAFFSASTSIFRKNMHICGTTSLVITRIFMHVNVTMARSSSGGVAICFVLLVLWTPSCLHIMATGQQNATRKGVHSKRLNKGQNRFWHGGQTDPLVGSCRPGSESAVYDCLVVSSTRVVGLWASCGQQLVCEYRSCRRTAGSLLKRVDQHDALHLPVR